MLNVIRIWSCIDLVVLFYYMGRDGYSYNQMEIYCIGRHLSTSNRIASRIAGVSSGRIGDIREGEDEELTMARDGRRPRRSGEA